MNEYDRTGQLFLSSFIPVGSSMTMSLTFNETYSDGSYDFADNLGPVSGNLSIGANTYSFDDYVAQSYASNPLLYVGTIFTGNGPAPAGSDLFGLYLWITPEMTLYSEPMLSFARTNVGRLHVNFTGEGTIVRANQIPEPRGLALVGAGLLGLAISRRRRG